MTFFKPTASRPARGFTIIEALLMLVALGLVTLIAGGLWSHYKKTGSLDSGPPKDPHAAAPAKPAVKTP